MKKAFTLIELLAVIIILAIVALIATPLILNVIEDAQESADLSQAYLILDAAENLYASSYLEDSLGIKNKFNGSDDLYEYITTSGEKPSDGDAYIKVNGQISLRVVINDTCYSKLFTQSNITKCDGYEEDTDSGSEQTNNNSSADSALTNEDTWYEPGSNIVINSQGYSWDYCVSNQVCEPDTAGNGNNVQLGTEGNQIVCISLIDGGRVISKQCEEYLIDSIPPEITAVHPSVTIMKGHSFYVPDYFNVARGESGTTLSCDTMETSKLELGTNTITCTNTNKSNVSSSATVEIIVEELVETVLSCFGMSGTSITSYNCSDRNITLPSHATSISLGSGYYNRIDSIILHEGITNVSLQQQNITSVILPSTVESALFRDGNVKNVEYKEGVSEVSDNAFNKNKVERLILPNTITNIGNNSFIYNNLIEINIPSSVVTIEANAFRANKIENIILNEGLINIESSSFTFNNIKELIIPESVELIESGAFSNSGILELEIKGNLNYESNAFSSLGLTKLYLHSTSDFSSVSFGTVFTSTTVRELELGEGTTEIYTNMFSNIGIDKLVLPSTLSTINQGAFNANNISNLVIPNSVITIGNSAFYNNNIKELSLSNSLVSIGDNAFGNNRIEYVTLNENLVTIGSSAFAYNELINVVIPDSVTSIGSSAFIENNLKTAVLPENLTEISVSLFKNNQLVNIVIPNSVVSIKENSFEGNKLTSVILPSGLTSLGSYAFYNNSIKNLIIPGSLSVVSQQSFAKNELKTIIIEEGVERIESSALFNVSGGTTITIPLSVSYIEGKGTTGINNNNLTVILKNRTTNPFTGFSSSTIIIFD